MTGSSKKYKTQLHAGISDQQNLGNGETDTLLELYRTEMFDLGKDLQPVGPRI